MNKQGITCCVISFAFLTTLFFAIFSFSSELDLEKELQSLKELEKIIDEESYNIEVLHKKFLTFQEEKEELSFQLRHKNKTIKELETRLKDCPADIKHIDTKIEYRPLPTYEQRIKELLGQIRSRDKEIKNFRKQLESSLFLLKETQDKLDSSLKKQDELLKELEAKKEEVNTFKGIITNAIKNKDIKP